jgi:hypothetical protein
MTYIERILDISTNEITERELTAAEVKKIEAAQAKAAAHAVEETKLQTQREAILDRLGITAEEAKLLLS